MRLRLAVPAPCGGDLPRRRRGPRAAGTAVIKVTPGEGTLQAALDAAPPGGHPRRRRQGPRAQRRRAGRDGARAYRAQLRAQPRRDRRRHLPRQARLGHADRGQPGREQPLRHLPARRPERAGTGQRGDRQQYPAHERARQRHRRRALPAQRLRRPSGLAPPAGQAAADQPLCAHPALCARLLPLDLFGRRGGFRPAHAPPEPETG